MVWPRLITIIAAISGILAALIMGSLYTQRFPTEKLPSTTFLARLLGGDSDQYKASGVILYIGYGGLAGGFYPWITYNLIGLSNKWIITLPFTLLSALAFGILLTGPWTILRILGYVDPPYQPADGFDDEQADKYITMAGLHLVYGLVLGFLVGLSQPLWFPFLGT